MNFSFFSEAEIFTLLLTVIKRKVSDSMETHYNHFYICHTLDQSRSVGKRTVRQMIDS